MKTETKVIKKGQNKNLGEVTFLTEKQYILVDGDDGTNKISVNNLKDELGINELGINDIHYITIAQKTTGVLYPVSFASTIEANEFYENEEIEMVSTNAISIGDYAFWNSSLRTIIANSATKIGYGAFGASELEYIEIQSATRIEHRGLQTCYNLTEVSGPNVESIGYSGCNGCRKVTKYSFPKLEYIDLYGIISNASLVDFFAPKIKGLNSRAFQGCTNITKYEFPDLAYCRDQVFCKNYALEAIYLNCSSSVFGENNFVDAGTGVNGLTFYITADYIDTYTADFFEAQGCPHATAEEWIQ